jgi:hypothetical protein
VDIENHGSNIARISGDGVDGCCAVIGRYDIIAELPEHQYKQSPDGFIVVGDENV